MLKPVTFETLEQFLLSLGFYSSPTKGSHRIYRHDKSDTLVILPGYKPGDHVREIHLVSIRNILDLKGLLNRDEFDRKLEKTRQNDSVRPAITRYPQSDSEVAQQTAASVGT